MHGFRYKEVDIDKLKVTMGKLTKKWTTRDWEDITGVTEHNSITNYVQILIKRYRSDINLETIEGRYLALIKKAENILPDLDDDDELLSLFSENNSKRETEIILRQLGMIKN